MLLFVSTVKLLCEIALLALAGRWLLGTLAGQAKESNVFYKILETVSQPFVRAARWITPKVILDRHLPGVAFLILAMLWLVCVLEKIRICVSIGVALCK